jgi:hypothetical protein
MHASESQNRSYDSGTGELEASNKAKMTSSTKMVRDTLGDHRVRRTKSLRTRAACKVGVDPWRRSGLNGLDLRLADALAWKSNGMFIELLLCRAHPTALS